MTIQVSDSTKFAHQVATTLHDPTFGLICFLRFSGYAIQPIAQEISHQIRRDHQNVDAIQQSLKTPAAVTGGDN